MKTRFLILAVLFAALSLAVFADNLRTVVIDGQQMMSLRTFGDTFNAAIDYDSGRDGFSITLGYRTVDMIPYARIAWVDDREVTLAAPVVIIDDETYVPLRFLSDAFGLDYQCADTYHQVTVINPCTLLRVVLAVDLDWGRAPHRVCRDYDSRDYRNYRVPATTHNIPPQERPAQRWDNQPPVRKSTRDDYQPQPWMANGNHGQVWKPTVISDGGRTEHGQPWVHEILPGGDSRKDTVVPHAGNDPKTNDARQGRWTRDGRNNQPDEGNRNGRADRQTASKTTDARQGERQDDNRSSSDKDHGRGSRRN